MANHRPIGCRPEDHPPIDRRTLLQVGGMSLVGMELADLMRLQAQAAPQARQAGKAKAVIFIFQSGGPSQHETWDPKPEAPAEIRGEYGTTATRLPSIRFCEYLPRLAQRANRFTIVRTMHHIAGREFRNEHNSCAYLLHTGTTELPPGDTNASIDSPRAGRIEWPSIGSLIAYGAPPQPGVPLPAMIELPRVDKMRIRAGTRASLARVTIAGASIWRRRAAPPDPAGSCPNCFSHDDPNEVERAPGAGPRAWWNNTSCRDASFKLPDIAGSLSVSASQLEDRASLVQRLDRMRQNIDAAPARAYDAHRQRAFDLLSAVRPGRGNPFDLSQESDRIRDLYGREEWGQGFLVARRLIEAGVRMVQVNLRGWDTHQNAFRDLKGRLLPSLDLALSGLIDDLEQRGLLDEVLIVMCGEMGRTPRISPIAAGGRNASGEIFTAGRHHWGDVFPCFFAGAGIEAGQVIGETDRHGGVPMSDAYTPEDLAATIFHCLGIGPDREFHDAAGRPYRIYRGMPIRGLTR